MKTVVIYHRADFDGIFCREIAKKFLPEAILIGWDYGDAVDDIKNGVNAEDQLYILDLSVDELMDHPNLIWIDHHKSAIDKYPATILGVRIDGVAACRLAWQWFFHESGRGDQSEGRPFTKEDYYERRVTEPYAVRLAGEYDIWDKRDPDADLFQHGLRSRDLTNDWASLLSLDKKLSVTEIESLIDIGMQNILRPDGTNPNPTVLGLLDAGRAIQYSKAKENESIIKAFGFTIQFEGFTLLTCNTARYNSQLFTAGLLPEHDGCLGFNWDGQQQVWRISLYTDKHGIDLSPVAIKYGGGGHRGACGFRCKELPFSLA